MSPFPWHHRRAHLDARVEDARRGAEQAAEEAKVSQERHDAIVERVVKPLRRAGERNQFADLIRKSLIEGHGRGS